MEEEFKKLELEQRWQQHYDMLALKSKKHSSEVGDSVANILLNRYVDVKTYDRTRVKLQRSKDTDYINANLVTVPKAARQYILTQGPLPETLSHFWLMIWEQKSSVIVMLNKILEMEDFVKCEQYWPEKLNSTVTHDEVKLSVTLKSIKVFKHYTIRELLLNDLATTDSRTDKSRNIKSRTVLQYHYTAWPDHGEPDSPTSLLRLLTAIRKSGGLDKMDEPPVVHCSAGIGRSGTFCLIDSVLSMIENQGSIEGIDIDNTLLEMRDYRMGLIQSPVQLKFAYMSIIYGVKILQAANKLQPHISSIMDTNPVFDNNPKTSPSTSTIPTSQEQTANQPKKKNGSSQSSQTIPKKPSRRTKKKLISSTSGSLNVFQKNLLIEALDDIDSDEADSLFYYTMRQLPNQKKPRNSSPEELSDDHGKRLTDLSSDSSKASSSIRQRDHGRLYDESTDDSMLSENMTLTTNPGDSVLMKRREKEMKNREMAEKIQQMKENMERSELSQRRWALFKKSIIGGAAAAIVSYLVYFYLNSQKI